MALRYLSTFSGIGGFELGIQAVVPDAECIGFSEIDKYAASVYQHHFPEAKNYGDIRTINPGELPKFDLFVGGFPCQAFSVAGKRLGFDDTRGTLFFEVARLLKAKRPGHLVLENVKGLLSHDSGKTFATILGVLTDLGYFVEWQVLNSKDHGVPQNRERVFIVGHLGSAPRRQVLPLPPAEHSPRQLVADDQCGTQAIATRHLSRNGALTSDISQTVQTGDVPHAVFGDRVRRMTPRECERLQGFPDDWTSESADGPVSDTQRYKMCGNAVTTKVVSAVIERLVNDGH